MPPEDHLCAWLRNETIGTKWSLEAQSHIPLPTIGGVCGTLFYFSARGLNCAKAVLSLLDNSFTGGGQVSGAIVVFYPLLDGIIIYDGPLGELTHRPLPTGLPFALKRINYCLANF